EGAAPPHPVAASRRQPPGRPGRDRADARDRHHTERDAGDEYVEAAQPAAQLTQRVTQAERGGPPGAGVYARETDDTFGGDAQALASMWPERSRTTRSQRRASELSWVTSTSVMPRSACLVKRSSMICLPVASSRFPVGSSATRMAGSGASARASA